MTHVDASRQTNTWAKENAKLSGLPETAIRFLDDDALKFAEREVRRGATYNGIVLDPPAFGRGTKGEVWKIEENLPRLLETLVKLLSPNPHSFFLLNGYAAGYSPLSFVQAIDGYFKNGSSIEFGELRLQETRSNRSSPPASTSGSCAAKLCPQAAPTLARSICTDQLMLDILNFLCH